MVIYKNNFLMIIGVLGNVLRKDRIEVGIWGIVIIWIWFGLGCFVYKNILLMIFLVFLKYLIYICIFFY